MPTRVVLTALLTLSCAGIAPAAVRNDRDRLRSEAEHACYVDAQRLCPDAIPDEGKVTACMGAKRARLSPACGKVYDRGIGI